MSKTNLLALACALVALVSLFATLHAGHPVQAHLVHSDALYLPVLFDDVLHRGGSLADWYLTPAPYFFPDFPLYLLAWLGADGVFGQTTAFALLQTLLMAAAIFFLAREALEKSRVLAAAALIILFVWLGLHVDDPFVRLYSSAHHYGAFIAAVLLAALWLRLDAGGLDGRHEHIVTVAIVALVYLTTLSDALFLVQAVAPLLAAALLHRPGGLSGTRPRHAALLLFLPAVLAMVSYRFVVAHPTRYKSRLGLSKLSANLDELGTICATLLGQRPLLAAALLLALLAGVASIAACLFRKAPAFPTRPLRLLMTFATLSCAATVAAMLLSTTVQPAPRYLIAALSLPLVAGMFALAHQFGGHFRYAGASLAIMFASLLAADAWHTRHHRDANAFYYPEQIACIDRALASTNARHGIAQYWDAKRVQALSRHPLILAQYHGELAPMPWITSERYFGTGYDFAIIAEQELPQYRLSRAQLTTINGEPVQTVICGDRSVLLFAPGRLRTSPAAPAY
ncbi:hypothetical protein [Massilia sp. Mn16-1_5]|uniref:hypothetical protein n=1 Tax=Massilia sp. Mn16-1_5 TaxID=2079199 RepID=UPI00109EBBC7|nr:hypothetical protein [Massilia sp. Mn16-1_5]THC45641.1 hypothetical protein C2862_03910 [Massilia sp. Mn16-1_5]